MHVETSRALPIVEESDLIVVGAGPAGICAALAAARRGLHVRLFDRAGCLGGVWTAGLLCWIIDAANKGGIVAELGSCLDQRGARRYRQAGGANFAYDPEAMKVLLEELCLAAGVRVQLHTRVVAVARQGSCIETVVTESCSGRQAWRSKLVVDASGNGDVGALAHCGFDMGGADGQMQPMTLCAMVTGIQFDQVEAYVGGSMKEPKRRLLQACRQGGFEPSYQPPVLFAVDDGLFCLAGNHAYGVRCDDAQAITDATMRMRSEVHQFIEALRCVGDPWQGLRLVATAEHIGVREGRRIHGRAQVTIDDMVAGHVPADSVAMCRFGIDVHQPDPGQSKGFRRYAGKKVQAYGIPLRSLIAKDCDNLLLAGRCLSGDFLAHSSYRVTGTAAATGEAAGLCAAQAILHDCSLGDVVWSDIATH